MKVTWGDGTSRTRRATCAGRFPRRCARATKGSRARRSPVTRQSCAPTQREDEINANSAPRVLDMAVKNASWYSAIVLECEDGEPGRGWFVDLDAFDPLEPRLTAAAAAPVPAPAPSAMTKQRAGQRRRFGLPERIAHVPVSVLRKRRTPMPAPSQAGLRRPTEAHRKVPLKIFLF